MKNYIHILYVLYIFPDDLDGKEYACNTGDPGLIPGEGNDNPLHYSCLKKSMDRWAWWITGPWGHKELDTTEAA